MPYEIKALELLDVDVESSFLVLTHDIGVIDYLTDTVIVMHRGRVVEEGPVRQILRDPQHDYTRTLLAAVPGAR